MICCRLEGKGAISDYDREGLEYLKSLDLEAQKTPAHTEHLLCEAHRTGIAEALKGMPKVFVLKPASEVRVQKPLNVKADHQQRAANDGDLIE